MRANTNLVTRNTKQKNAIRAAFVETGRPLSPEEVLSYAQRNVADLSIATVYRNLKIMVEEKWLTAVQLPGEPSRYEISGKPHHHHFWCNDCGKVYELEGCTPRLKDRKSTRLNSPVYPALANTTISKTILEQRRTTGTEEALSISTFPNTTSRFAITSCLRTTRDTGGTGPIEKQVMVKRAKTPWQLRL